MSLFQCENCGCCENTALSHRGFTLHTEDYDWTGIEDREGMNLCSACGPSLFSDGTPCKGGEWHGEFERVYLPMGKFRTAQNGNLEHIETGDQDFRKHALDEPDRKRDAVVGRWPMSLPRLAAVAGIAMLAPTGSTGLPSDRITPSPRRSRTLDEIEKSTRDDQARKDKAEAKRRRRMKRNQRMAAKEQ